MLCVCGVCRPVCWREAAVWVKSVGGNTAKWSSGHHPMDVCTQQKVLYKHTSAQIERLCLDAEKVNNREHFLLRALFSQPLAAISDQRNY